MPGIMGKPEQGKEGHVAGEMAADTDLKGKAVTKEDDEVPKVNGVHAVDHKPYTNGVAASSPPPEVQHQAINAMDSMVSQLPPEVAHITASYVPMSGLVRRLVQETYNGLLDVLGEMADIPSHQQQMNGIVPHMHHRIATPGSGDSSPANVQKRTLMFDFANSRRTQFIKVLVLSRWARQVEAIGRTIDIRQWLFGKKEDYNDAIIWMGELKRILVESKEPKPDIETALEVLSLGKESRLSNFGYRPPPQLSGEETLEGLRRLNVLLSIRLNIHETIPPMLKNFSIASGRATFRVPEEFEVDLSIADEDPSKQLFLLDMRMTFAPSPAGLPPGRLRDEFDTRANAELGQGGLAGLFIYIHNVVLTHKLHILRAQAFEMARGHWSDHIKVEPVQRGVVVQYWCERPGGKNWVEIGVKCGVAGHISLDNNSAQTMPQMALRWFRAGKETQAPDVDLRTGNLSMEYIIKQVIARHANFFLAGMTTKLRASGVFTKTKLRTHQIGATIEPADAAVLVQLTTTKAIKITQEPVSGRLAILPAINLNSRAERELNRLAKPDIDGAQQILFLRALAAQEEAKAVARRIGWISMRPVYPSQDLMEKIFTKSIQRIQLYERSSWQRRWALAFTTSHDKDCWWAVELGGQSITTSSIESAVPSTMPLKAYQVLLGDADGSFAESSTNGLIDVERTAAGMISQFSDTSYLASHKIPLKVQARRTVNGTRVASSIYARLPAKQAPPSLRSPNTLSLPWAHEVVRIDYQGLNASHTLAIIIASARLNRPYSKMKPLAANLPDVAFHPSSGAFALRIRSKVGETSIPQLMHQVRAIGRLHDFIATIKDHHLKIDSFSAEKLHFTYQQIPRRLTASIAFPAEDEPYIALSAPNPHLRILDCLNSCLRAEGLTAVLALMKLTSTLLSALSKLESSHKSASISILARSEQWFRVLYSPPAMKGSFDIQLRYRGDELMWFVPEPSIKKTDTSIDDAPWQQSLREVTRGQGKGWRGMNGGVVCSLPGVEEALDKIDAVFSSAAKHVPEESRPGKRKAETDVVEID